jgi:hypothetical protein
MKLLAFVMAIGVLTAALPAQAATTDTTNQGQPNTTNQGRAIHTRHHPVLRNHPVIGTNGLHSGTDRNRITTGRSKTGAGQEPGNEVIQDRDQRRSN